MARYKPSIPFSVAFLLYKPTYTRAYGVETKTYPKQGVQFFGCMRSFGGTERDINGVYSVEKTAKIETWFNPEITSECLIEVAETGEKYEILGDPENVEMRNQYLILKVRKYSGGA